MEAGERWKIIVEGILLNLQTDPDDLTCDQCRYLLKRVKIVLEDALYV